MSTFQLRIYVSSLFGETLEDKEEANKWMRKNKIRKKRDMWKTCIQVKKKKKKCGRQSK